MIKLYKIVSRKSYSYELKLLESSRIDNVFYTAFLRMVVKDPLLNQKLAPADSVVIDN